MKVKKDSWHYRLVEHKSFVSELEDSNEDAMNYLHEVYVGIFIRILIIPLLLAMILSFPLAQSGQLKEHFFWVYVFFIIVSSPIWFMPVSLFIEPFTPKKWRKLEIV